MLGLGAVISPKAKSHVLRGSLETTIAIDSYISIPITNILFRGNHSFSTWVKLKVSNIDTTNIGYKHATKSARQEYFVTLYGQDFSDPGTILFTQRSGLGLSRKSGLSGISKSDSRSSKWCNIVVTTQSTAGGNTTDTKIYINGIQGSSQASTAMTAAQKEDFAPTSAFIFGGLNFSAGSTVNHTSPNSIRVSSFSAWSRTLAPSEITTIYKGGRGRKLHRNIGDYTSSNDLKLDYNFNSVSQDGSYKSTGSVAEVAVAKNCIFTSDHPSSSTGRLQG